MLYASSCHAARCSVVELFAKAYHFGFREVSCGRSLTLQNSALQLDQLPVCVVASTARKMNSYLEHILRLLQHPLRAKASSLFAFFNLLLGLQLAHLQPTSDNSDDPQMHQHEAL